MLEKYFISKINNISFIDKGIYGAVFHDTGIKHYSVNLDLCLNSKENIVLLKDLPFFMTQDALDSILKYQCLYYDPNACEYLRV